jgi:hypothetical protein
VTRLLQSAAVIAAIAVGAGVLLIALISAAGTSMAEATSSSGASSGAAGDAQYYRSAVARIEPAVSGLSVVTQNAGSVTLVNRTGKTVTVLGYAGEPYLRVTSDGVDENINSLSASLNTVAGQTSAPRTPVGSRPTDWHHLTDGSTVTWRDYRTHWASRQRPPVVDADPQHPHQVFEWAMRLRVADEPVLVQGVVRWTGAPRFSRPQILALTAGIVIMLLLALVLIGINLRRQATKEVAAAH